ncbi:hypothetical protein D3C84_594310 [compost metagenome]
MLSAGRCPNPCQLSLRIVFVERFKAGTTGGRARRDDGGVEFTDFIPGQIILRARNRPILCRPLDHKLGQAIRKIMVGFVRAIADLLFFQLTKIIVRVGIGMAAPVFIPNEPRSISR